MRGTKDYTVDKTERTPKPWTPKQDTHRQWAVISMLYLLGKSSEISFMNDAWDLEGQHC